MKHIIFYNCCSLMQPRKWNENEITKEPANVQKPVIFCTFCASEFFPVQMPHFESKISKKPKMSKNQWFFALIRKNSKIAKNWNKLTPGCTSLTTRFSFQKLGGHFLKIGPKKETPWDPKPYFPMILVVRKTIKDNLSCALRAFCTNIV